MKKTVAVIFAVAIITSAAFLAYGYKTRGEVSGNISVTGMGSQDFESDLVVWSASFSTKNVDLNAGIKKLSSDRDKVKSFLKSKGIVEDKQVFSSVDYGEKRKSIYNDGRYVGSEFVAYDLSQTVTIQSDNLDLIDEVSRQISDLLNEGVVLTSHNPKYYYTQLDDLKLDLIEEASRNGRQRAEQIAAYSESKLGGLKSAKQGVFQILGKNSSESFSWGGTFNTSHRKKTASVTVKMEYDVE